MSGWRRSNPPEEQVSLVRLIVEKPRLFRARGQAGALNEEANARIKELEASNPPEQ